MIQLTRQFSSKRLIEVYHITIERKTLNNRLTTITLDQDDERREYRARMLPINRNLLMSQLRNIQEQLKTVFII